MAIRMYRMALDKLPKECQSMRNKILKNIGHAFVKIGKFQEAITSYETVMEEYPDFQSSFNLIICLYALGDTERMKACYVNMLNIEIPGLFEEEEEEEF
jgi:intraflagellar transport protein 88